MTDWNPQQYRKFADERSQPFYDLLGLVEPGRIDTAVDLGCGSGELTADAQRMLNIATMRGVDSSAKMLAEAASHASDTLTFDRGDLAQWPAAGESVDLVIANASLHWTPDHPEVLRRWRGGVRAGGQIAVQVPSNADRPQHRIATELADREPFRSAFGADGPPPDPVAHNVLLPEAYADLLNDLGFTQQHVHLRVYGHVLADSAAVVEWVRGTMLTRFEKVLAPDVFAAFVDEYRRELVAELGDRKPYFFGFKRVLMWGRLAPS